MSKHSFPILMYHSIAKFPKGTPMRSLHVSPKLFLCQMRILKWLGYRGVSMSELMPYLRGEKVGKVVGITFDDGYKNNLSHALPILKKFSFTATCYLVSQNIGGNNYWDLEKGIPENPIMNKTEVFEWLSNGMEIGSHSQNHIRLSEYSKFDFSREISNSKHDLESTFNCNVNHFCYPYGDYNEQIISEVKSAGYESATTVNRGKASPKDNIHELPRVFITHRTLAHLFLMKVLSNYENKRR